MVKIFEATGKTVEEALDAVCALAGVGLDEGEVEVIDYASKGFLGIGSKEAKVRFVVSKMKYQDTENEVKNNIETIKTKDEYAKKQSDIKKEKFINDVAKESKQIICLKEDELEVIKKEMLAFLQPIFQYMKVSPEINWENKEDVLCLSFTGKGLNVLIGRRGETLNSLQYLANLVCNRKKESYIRIVLDVENYRAGRERTLIALAQKMAEKAVRTERRVELEPMNPHERRVVHIALQNDKRVETLSRGEEPYRRIVIVKKNSRNRNNK